MTWDTRLGVKTKTTDPNGLAVNDTYDGFGRSTGSTGPFPASSTNVTYAWCNNSCHSPAAVYEITTSQAGGESVTVEYDDKGRKVFTTKTGLNGQPIYQETHYDLFGRPYLVSAPYTQADAVCWTYTEYDVLNRPTHVYRAANDDQCSGSMGGALPTTPPSAYTANVTTTYDGLTTTVTTPSGTTTTTDNLLGKPDTVTETVGTTSNPQTRTTTYTYALAGNLASKKLPNGAITSMTYDAAGNKISMSSSSSGNWTYSYDALGELLSQTQPDGGAAGGAGAVTISQSYDNLGRLIQRVAPDIQNGGTVTTSWTYDTAPHGIGKLADESDTTGFDRSYTYTAYSQLQDETTTLPDTSSYTVSRTYDAYGRLSSLSYPESAPPPADTAPVATVSASSTTVTIGTAVTLDASASSDPDSGPQPLGYLWHQTAGPSTGVDGQTDATASFTPQTPGTYSFSVDVGDGQAYGTANISIAVTPKAPTLVSVLPNPTSTGTFTVQWNGANTGATSYQVKEHAIPDGGTASDNSYPVLGADSATWSPSSPYGNGTYVYTVVGCAASLCGPPSSSTTESVTLPPGPPGAPQYSQNGAGVASAIGPTGGPATVTVSWSVPAGKVTSYKFYERDVSTGTVTNPAFSGTSATVSFTDDRASHEFWVVACNGPIACTEGAHSYITSYFKPGTPGSFGITPNPSDGPYTLTWTKPAGTIINYELWQSVNGGGYTLLTNSIASGATSYATSNYNNNYTYNYRLYADNGPARSDGYGQGGVSVYLLPSAPASVTVPGQSNASGDFTVTWSASTYATYYKAQAGIYDNELKTYHWLGTPVSVGNTTSHTFHQSDGDYYYRIQACNHVDSICSTFRQSTSSVTVLNAPGMPNSIAASPTAVNSDQSYTISWGAGSGSITNYQLQEDLQDSTFASPTTFNMGTARSKAFSHYHSGTPRLHDHYYYRVRACNSAGCSGWRGTVSVTVTATFSGGGGGGTCPPTCTQVVGPASLSAPTTTTTSSTDGGPLSLNMPHRPVLAPLPPASNAFAPTKFAGALHIDRSALAIAPAGAVTAALLAATRGLQAGEPVVPRLLPVLNDGKLIAHTAPTSVTTRPAARLAVLAAAASGASARYQSSGLRSTPGGQVATLHTAAWHPKPTQKQGRAATFRYAPTAGAWYRQLKLSPAAMTTTVTPATTTTGYRLTLHYNYDANGHVVQVYGPDPTHPYWTAESADAMGHVTGAREGNGVTIANVYDHATGALRAASAGAGVNADVQLAEYTYDASGNLTSRADQITGQSETYTYDSGNRLLSATATLSGGTQATTLTATYDAAGNIATKDGQAYSYDASHPNQLQSVAGSAIAYDNAGRILTGTDQLSVGWNAFGKPYSITRTVEGQNHLAQFWYDPEHVRYKQVVDGTEEISLEGGAYQLVHNLSGPDTTYRMAILVGGAVVGQFETSTNSTDNAKIHYFYTDNLGSVAVIADGAGAVTQRLAYAPFGERRDATNWNNPLSVVAILALNLPTDRGFTGQHSLDALKLVDYGGRIYDLETARFLSPDPTGAEYNPYAYVGNNPESLTDPTGYFGILDAVKIVVIAIASYYTAGWAASYFAAGSVAGTAAGGAAGGFMSGFLGSGGNLRAGLLGAAGGAAFGAIGAYGGFNNLEKGLAAGTAGGLLSEAGGGNFGDGFLGAFAGMEISLNAFPGDTSGGAIAARVIASAAVGGTVSELNGGNFANGAESAAFAALFAEELHAAAQNDGSGEPGDVDENHLRTPSPLHISTSTIVSADGHVIHVVEISGTYTDATSSGIGGVAADDINKLWTGDFVESGSVSYRIITHLTRLSDPFAEPDITFNTGFCNGGNSVACRPSFNVIRFDPSQVGHLGAATAAHEFGHALGFYHFANSTGNIMSYAGVRAVQLRNAQLLWKYYGH